ncbi:hypothetical protein FOXB_01022 [Fusarium oxysporum f. sp. conglutinans Fo5176]|uniref:Uncharacterized protein n=1 Tax=Fusarium oxysporum (strain Fo5176) TaxID=660025 RepID=F9F3P7_FUSOF|nr:hypothetical protein FOXB_01022 [Fusarium oxysporum f. sp. conglutinans Fo5176]
MSGDSAEHIASALSLGFSMGVWLALAIHAIGIEVYKKWKIIVVPVNVSAHFHPLKPFSYVLSLLGKCRDSALSTASLKECDA